VGPAQQKAADLVQALVVGGVELHANAAR
jgi:hypothetical protein